MLKGLKGILEKGLQIAAPFIGNAILPGGLGATFGSGIASLLTGNKPKDALMSAGATYLSGFGNPQGSPLSKLFGNKSPEEFNKHFPDIGLLVDLDTDERRLKLYWPKIRDRVYELLTEAIMRDGMINYDSNTGRIQIKDASLKQCYMISGFDIIDCEIKGNIYQCDMFTCELDDCIVEESNVFNNSNLKKCRIFNSYINRNNKLYDCWFAGSLGVMNGEMTNGIFREGKVGKFAKFNGTEVIDKEKIKMTSDWRGGAFV